MKKKFLIGAALGLVAFAAADLAIGHWSVAASSPASVDVASIHQLEVRGAASRLIISASDKEPYTAQLRAVRSGWGALWRTGWLAEDCSVAGSLEVRAATLEVDTGDSAPFAGWRDCALELRVNVRPETSVLISQQAAEINMIGNFSQLDIRSDAGDVRLDGHAEVLTISGAALRVRLTFEKILKTETIRLLGRMMDAALLFPAATAISYIVETKASFIDSALANTPGAKPAITIRGDMVRATIR